MHAGDKLDFVKVTGKLMDYYYPTYTLGVRPVNQLWEISRRAGPILSYRI